MFGLRKHTPFLKNFTSLQRPESSAKRWLLQRDSNVLKIADITPFDVPGIDDSDDDDLDADHDTQRLINDLLVTLSSGVDEECSVCLDSLVEPVITRCAHVFCQQCIMDVITSDTSAPNCPLCRAPVNENDLIKVPEKKKKKSTEVEKPNEESGKYKKITKV